MIMEKEFFNNLGFLDIDDYINRHGNEILSDEVWVWRLKESLKEELLGISDFHFSYIFKLIILDIIKKGGVIADYSGAFADTINLYLKNGEIEKLSSNIVIFLKDNPNYGSDGNGIWFE